MQLSLLHLSFLAAQIAAARHHLDDPDLFHFVTRPDLRAPRWDITVYHEGDSAQLSPGYWFIAPKQSRRKLINTNSAWIGPHIYSTDGELVWSGASQLDTANVNDFRVSMVDGEQMLSFFDRDRQAGVVLDSHYRIHRVLDLRSENVNAHEFNILANGRSALVLKNDLREMTQHEQDIVGLSAHGHTGCLVQYTRFQELDLESGEVVFEFDSRGHIGVDETREWLEDGEVSAQCKEEEGWWDFLHGNSVDKCPDGDSYLFGSRFLSTIYKISADTGEVVWRLGGLKSDFNLTHDDMVGWSQQHDVRCRHQNSTHTIISLLDNQVSPYVRVENAERKWSRGLIMSVNEVDMTAELLAEYDHPHHEYDPRRGNLQMLPNGNVFIGWSERALHSERVADGTLLMEAQLKAKWMGSYRNYKFDFNGRPLGRPDVVARTYFWQRDNATTGVYVSWNGDTRVRSWRLYKSSVDGRSETLLAEVKREGFETFLSSPTYAEYVKMIGIDDEGRRVEGGESAVVKTEEHPSSPDSVEAGKMFPEIELNTGFGYHAGYDEDESEKEDPEPGYDDGSFAGRSGEVYTSFIIAATCFVLGCLTRPWLSVLLSWILRICPAAAAEYEYEEIAMEDELGKASHDSDDDDDLLLYDDGLMDGKLDTLALPDR